MPFISVSSPVNALTGEQKAKLAPLLVEAVMSQETDSMTDIGRAATGMIFNEIDEHNCFPGGVSLTDHCVVIEIPEGSWGAGGQTTETDKIQQTHSPVT